MWLSGGVEYRGPMQSFWRNDIPLHSHADWCGHLDTKTKKAGTSAPTLAAMWAGPVELWGALHLEPAFDGAVIDKVVAEVQASFDRHRGGKRNHDLVVHLRLASGDRLVVCVEAKAGEDLGPTVEQYRKRAETTRSGGEKTNAPERLDDLLARYVPHDPSGERVRKMRYQLLSALAGTVAVAAQEEADHAVLMLHEAITDQRPNDAAARHEDELRRFATTVFDREPPATQRLPWCLEVPSPEGMAAKLYLARAVTDFRTATLEQEGD